jgi:hypothetical protein
MTLKDSSKMTSASPETNALGNAKIGEFEPLPPRDDRPIAGEITLLGQLLNPAAPLETGEWSAESGYIRDETDEDRATKAALIEEIKRYATGR